MKKISYIIKKMMINSYTVSPASFSDPVYSKRFFLLVSTVRILAKSEQL